MKYILITWPYSQILMEQDWFEECFLANPSNDVQYNIAGSSAYFVPESRVKELWPELVY